MFGESCATLRPELLGRERQRDILFLGPRSYIAQLLVDPHLVDELNREVVRLSKVIHLVCVHPQVTESSLPISAGVSRIVVSSSHIVLLLDRCHFCRACDLCGI